MAKTANYTDHDVEIARSMYIGVRGEDEARRSEVVDEIAAILGKARRSVIAKLSRETMEDGSSVYVAKQIVSKVTKGDPAKKIELATDIAKLVAKVNPETLANAGKTDLVAILAALTPADPVDSVDEDFEDPRDMED